VVGGGDDDRKWWIVGAISLVFLPLVIDFYGIVVTLPAIGRDLHSSTSSLAWTAAAAAEVEQIVRSSFDHGSKRG
jgi:hypothetical protein